MKVVFGLLLLKCIQEQSGFLNLVEAAFLFTCISSKYFVPSLPRDVLCNLQRLSGPCSVPAFLRNHHQGNATT